MSRDAGKYLVRSIMEKDGDAFRRLFGKRFTELAFVFDTDTRCDHADEPVVLVFEDTQLELRLEPMNCLEIAWNTIDLGKPPVVLGLEDCPDIVWKRFDATNKSERLSLSLYSGLHRLAAFLGFPLKAMELLGCPRRSGPEPHCYGLRLLFDPEVTILYCDQDNFLLLDKMTRLSADVALFPLVSNPCPPEGREEKP